MNNKLLKNSETCVYDNARAWSHFNTKVVCVSGKAIVVRRDISSIGDRVAILCGGGGGHEPAHAGFVGAGMLSAAVSGNVFAAPPPNVILEALLQVGRPSTGGVLVIVANYTGDRINFNIASERAKKIGINVEIIVVGEDTALKSVNRAAGRRGLAGVVLIEKISGAMSENKRSIKDIKGLLNRILEPGLIGTIGISFSGCTPPGTSGISFDLPKDIYELGLGIHGEAGVKKEKFVSMEETIKVMVNQLTALGFGHVNLQKDDDVVVLVNNLGSCVSLEMFALASYLFKYLETRFLVKVIRGYCGSYVTSLEMYGFSITILKVTEKYVIECLDAPTDAPAWNKLVYKSSEKTEHAPISPILNDKSILERVSGTHGSRILSDTDSKQLIKAILFACEAIIGKENYLNDLDKEIGDSDCGSTFRRGAQAIQDFVQDSSNLKFIEVPYLLLLHLSNIIETSMGGSSGGLLSLYFEAISSQLKVDSKWSELFFNATRTISDIGGAIEGDRTMLDVLFPVCKEWKTFSGEKLKQILSKLSIVAEKSAADTVNMTAKAGRASYVGETSKAKGPDPGAEAICIIIKAMASSF